jgi:hypothetical protein
LANVAIFSMVDARLLASAADEQFGARGGSQGRGFVERLPANTRRTGRRRAVPANMLDWKRRDHVATGIAAIRGGLRAVTGDGQPQPRTVVREIEV